MQLLKLVLTSFFILMSGLCLRAQSSFPAASDHQVWEYVTWNFWGGGCYKSFVKTGEEVDICGQLFTEVYDCSLTPNDCQLIGYYRVKADSVMVLDLNYEWNGSTWEITPDCARGERLMYDFNAKVGDSLLCGIDYPIDTTEFWKVADSLITYEGTPRRVSQMRFYPYPNAPDIVYNMSWIRNIGANIHPFYSLSCIGDQCEQEQQMTKVTRNGLVIYVDTILMFSFPCTSWETAVEDEVVLEENMLLYPNPTTDKCTIESLTNETIDDIKIYDLMGREVSYNYFDKQKNELSLEGLAAGIYYVLISLNEQFIIKKMIKSD